MKKIILFLYVFLLTISSGGVAQTNPHVTDISTVANIAALRALKPSSSVKYAVVRGYYSDADGGGGTFYWLPTSTAIDNAGSVINKTGNTGAGRWLRDKTIYDLKDFGAKGDGIADDSVAWKAFLTCGGELTISSGTYLINLGDTFDRIPVTKDTYIRGTNAIVKATGATLHMMGLDDSGIHNITIQGITFDGNSLARRGIDILKSSSAGGVVKIQQVVCKNMHGIYSAGNTNSAFGVLVDGRWSNISVEETTVFNITSDNGVLARQGITLAHTTGINRIDSCSVHTIVAAGSIATPTERVDADGIFVQVEAPTTVLLATGTSTISNNIITNCDGRGIKLQAPGALVEHNLIKQSAGVPIINHRMIDSQAGSVTILDNVMLVETGVTIPVGSSQCFLSLQGNTTREITLIAQRNIMKTQQAIPYGCLISGDGAYDTTFDLLDNTFDGDIRAMHYIVNNRTSANTAGTTVRLRGNKTRGGTETRYFLDITGDYFADYTRAKKFKWFVENNHAEYSTNASKLIYYRSASPFRGYVKISGNTGWFNPGVAFQVGSFLDILPGSSFFYTTESDSGVIPFPCPVGWETLIYIERTAAGVTLASGTRKLNIDIPPNSSLGSWIVGTAYP